MPLNYPDTGNDYDTLAQLEKPVMMPNAPVGAGGMAGMMYAQDQQRQSETFEKVRQLAAVNEMMKRQAASEYMQGASGRQSQIQLGNIMSQAQLEDAPNAVAIEQAKSQTAKSKALTAKQEALLDEANPASNIWVNSPDKTIARQAMKGVGIDKIGGKNVDDIPDDVMDKLMAAARQRQIQTPAQVQKIEQEKQSGQNWIDRMNTSGQWSYMKAQMQEENKNQRATDRNAAQEKIAKMKTDDVKDFAKDYEIRLGKAMRGEGPEPTDGERAMYETIITNKNYAAMLRGGQTAPQVDPDQLPGVPLKRPPVAAPAPMPRVSTPPGPPAPAKPKLDLENGTVTGTDGKTQSIVSQSKEKDSSGNPTFYVLKDGTKYYPK